MEKTSNRNKKSDLLKEFESLRKKLIPLGKKIKKNPLLLVCDYHKATKQKIKKLRKDHSWRGLARVTSDGKCTNQICGMFLCIWAGVDKMSE